MVKRFFTKEWTMGNPFANRCLPLPFLHAVGFSPVTEKYMSTVTLTPGKRVQVSLAGTVWVTVHYVERFYCTRLSYGIMRESDVEKKYFTR